MELLAWLWVWDARWFFNIEHRSSRIVFAFLVPMMITTVVIIQHTIYDQIINHAVQPWQDIML